MRVQSVTDDGATIPLHYWGLVQMIGTRTLDSIETAVVLSVSLNEIDRTCRLLFEAVDRMHAITPALLASPVGSALSRTTLAN